MNVLAGYTSTSSAEHRHDRTLFLLEFLRFAKTHGTPVTDGWECVIAAGGVMRRWPRCSGSRYKEHLDWAINAGVIELTREKRQSGNGTGRPRTFVIRVPMTRHSAELTREDAIAEADKLNSRAIVVAANDISVSETNDRYEDWLPPKGEDEKSEAKASVQNTVIQKTNQCSGTDTPDKFPENLSGFTSEHKGAKDNEFNCQQSGQATGRGRTEPNRRVDEGSERSGCPDSRLATGTPERSTVQHAVQELRDRALGTQRTAHAEGECNQLTNPKALAMAFLEATANAKSKPLRPTVEELNAIPPMENHESIAVIIGHQLGRSLTGVQTEDARLVAVWNKIASLAQRQATHIERWLLLSHPEDLTDERARERLNLLCTKRTARRRYRLKWGRHR